MSDCDLLAFGVNGQHLAFEGVLTRRRLLAAAGGHQSEHYERAEADLGRLFDRNSDHERC